MDVRLVWSLAETSYGVMAIAAVAAAWCVGQRSVRGRETTLFCASVAALAVHYGCLAVDAVQHATSATHTPVTVWHAFGQTSLLMSGALLVAYLLAMVTRLYAPAHPPRRFVWPVVAHLGLASAAAVWMSIRLAWCLVIGAPSVVVGDRVNDIVGVGGSTVAVMTFMGPLAYLGALLHRLPTGGGPAWLRWLKRAGAWPAGVEQTPGAKVVMPTTTNYAIRLMASAFLWTACVISGPWWPLERVWTPWTLGSVIALRLLLLPSLLALVYYHARFVFFDVLVKRGVALGVLAVLATTALFVVGVAILPADAQLGLGLVCALATLIVSSSTIVIGRIDECVDRVLFHRPNYREELPAISEAMARCDTTDSLTSTLTSHLRGTLDAAFVRFSPTWMDPSAVAISVGPRDHGRGVLELGPRAHGQPYGSEDLTFVDATAAQLAAHLHAFDAQESARLATAAELKALRAQINPHFLFNALNTLAEMSHGQSATERAILNLAQVFRYALESTQHERVPLGAEIDAVRAYLEIEAERFEDHLRFEIDVSDEVRDIPIPPMLLQPLVENAIRHGLSAQVRGGLVRIGALRDNGHVRLTVQDDGVGFDVDRTSIRVGLANVGARVERTGGSWRIQSIPGVGTLVTLAVAP